MTYPHIDPIIFSLGPLHVRWYGLMYVLGFACSYLLVQKQIKEFKFLELEEHFENLNLVLILSVVLGGRFGYILFYNLKEYISHPSQIFAIWEGGMSFHGACITLIVVGWIFCKKKKLDFWKTADLYIVTVPLGLGFGRIGNFINGELFGRVTDSPLGMVFPGGGPFPRHPSQLYEAALEGLVLFIILWSLHRRPWKDRWPHGSMLALFLIFYGCFRIFVENFRQPDIQIGFLFAHITMGQFLSSVMILFGALLWVYRSRAQRK